MMTGTRTRRHRSGLASRLAGLLVLGLALGGCALFPDGPLDAGVFVSESVDTADDPELFDGVEVTVEVEPVGDEPWVSWQAECGTASAPVRIDGDRLALRDDVITTAIGCDTAKQGEQDQWLAEFFEAGPRWERSGDGLRLTSVDGTSEIVLVRQPADADQ